MTKDCGKKGRTECISVRGKVEGMQKIYDDIRYDHMTTLQAEAQLGSQQPAGFAVVPGQTK